MGALGQLYRERMARDSQDHASRLRRDAIDRLLGELDHILRRLEGGDQSQVEILSCLVRFYSAAADFRNMAAWADQEDARAFGYEFGVANFCHAYGEPGAWEKWLREWPETRPGAIADPKY